ncbi:MAG: hypothetical protein P0Y64_10975 [Candidatus Sphingomonas colombiensis]|nr:hypothetical protein [Sphingomonas sp.]WEK41927.1 MAG: hypothetical protein P0Y64_10975 [Sphingomonas sp.]
MGAPRVRGGTAYDARVPAAGAQTFPKFTGFVVDDAPASYRPKSRRS